MVGPGPAVKARALAKSGVRPASLVPSATATGQKGNRTAPKRRFSDVAGQPCLLGSDGEKKGSDWTVLLNPAPFPPRSLIG